MKKIKTFIIIFIFVFMLSGCYKSETTLRINPDRSVDLDTKILVDNDFNETPYMNNMSSYNNRNIKIQRINESKYSGYKITKSYGSIDDISYEDDVKIELSKFFDADFNDKYLFKVEKGFFKNIYTANFTIDNSVIMRFVNNEIDKQTNTDFLNIVKEIYNNGLNEFNKSKTEKTYSSEKNELKIDDVKYEIVISKNGYVTKLTASNDSFSYSKEGSKILLKDIIIDDVKKTTIDEKKTSDTSGIKFVVKLPGASINNNASEVSGSGETLTWVFNQNKNNDISFSFELPNKQNYIMIIGFGSFIFVLLIILIVLAIKVKDRRREKIESEPIFMSDDQPQMSNTIREIEGNTVQPVGDVINIDEKDKIPDVINIE